MRAEQILRLHLSWVTGPVLASIFSYTFGDLLASVMPGGLHRIPHFVPVFQALLFVSTSWYLVEALGHTRWRRLVERGPALTVIGVSVWIYQMVPLSLPMLTILLGVVASSWTIVLIWYGFLYRQTPPMQVVDRKSA